MDNRIKTCLLLTGMAVIIMTLGQIIGGSQGLIIAFIIALVTNIGVYWFSASLVLAKTRARVVGPADAPDLYKLVEHLAGRAGLPTPKVAIVDDPAPNAFATGRNPQNAVVAVTTGLLKLVNREELAGVLGHELAHVKHRDILIGSVAAVMATVIMFLANMAKFASLFSGFRGDNRRGGAGNLLAGILLAVLAPLAALLIQAAISRSREYLADDGGADIAGSSLGLASALDKLQRSQGRIPMASASPETASLYIVNPLSVSTFKNLFSTHPPTEERINRLRGMTI
ncbi:MAG: zinc metalloprotease HtpX [Deltaproteobacteria bacterium]|jgi:heat shock protein HtpX|nr:zinc metalloprotease HtpX [Deltaproteobacteria bacterium]